MIRAQTGNIQIDRIRHVRRFAQYTRSRASLARAPRLYLEAFGSADRWIGTVISIFSPLTSRRRSAWISRPLIGSIWRSWKMRRTLPRRRCRVRNRIYPASVRRIPPVFQSPRPQQPRAAAVNNDRNFPSTRSGANSSSASLSLLSFYRNLSAITLIITSKRSSRRGSI